MKKLSALVSYTVSERIEIDMEKGETIEEAASSHIFYTRTGVASGSVQVHDGSVSYDVSMTREEALAEFNSLLSDDDIFDYEEDEFENWITDLEIEIK